MQMIQDCKVKEKLYQEKLANGLTVLLIPKKNTDKTFVIWGTKFGSIDNHFIEPKQQQEVIIPDGVAHFLEHKLFEQKDGTNSLDTLTGLGVDANAYTTTDHTAYLFGCNKNFEKALDEFMDYVQNPYFTDENVEKEKGIIGQEIMMYADHPGWKVYMNAMANMYEKSSIRIDTAGSIESISKIDKEMLYQCYHTFYHLSNMVLVICGDFVPEKMLEQVKKRIVPKQAQGEIKRIYEEEPQHIVKEKEVVQLEVSMPLFVFGIKDKVAKQEEKVKKHIAIEILLNMMLGKSSDTFQKLYQEGYLLVQPDLEYEFSDEYAHILISGQSKDPQQVMNLWKTTIEKMKKEGLEEKHFNRIKRKIYGDYIKEYNDVADIARMFLADWMKHINSFEYLEQYEQVTKEYAQSVLQDVFKEEQMVISMVEPNHKE